jgi:hypothetical protein
MADLQRSCAALYTHQTGRSIVSNEPRDNAVTSYNVDG